MPSHPCQGVTHTLLLPQPGSLALRVFPDAERIFFQGAPFLRDLVTDGGAPSS